jgi:hypothetical protein
MTRRRGRTARSLVKIVFKRRWDQNRPTSLNQPASSLPSNFGYANDRSARGSHRRKDKDTQPHATAYLTLKPIEKIVRRREDFIGIPAGNEMKKNMGMEKSTLPLVDFLINRPRMEESRPLWDHGWHSI